jgi:hypothetical protein
LYFQTRLKTTSESLIQNDIHDGWAKSRNEGFVPPFDNSQRQSS